MEIEPKTLINGEVDIDAMITFVNSKCNDHDFIRETLIKSGVYDENMQLTEKYKITE